MWIRMSWLIVSNQSNPHGADILHPRNQVSERWSCKLSLDFALPDSSWTNYTKASIGKSDQIKSWNYIGSYRLGILYFGQNKPTTILYDLYCNNCKRNIFWLAWHQRSHEKKNPWLFENEKNCRLFAQSRKDRRGCMWNAAVKMALGLSPFRLFPLLYIYINVYIWMASHSWTDYTTCSRLEWRAADRSSQSTTWSAISIPFKQPF